MPSPGYAFLQDYVGLKNWSKVPCFGSRLGLTGDFNLLLGDLDVLGDFIGDGRPPCCPSGRLPSSEDADTNPDSNGFCLDTWYRGLLVSSFDDLREEAALCLPASCIGTALTSGLTLGESLLSTFAPKKDVMSAATYICAVHTVNIYR